MMCLTCYNKPSVQRLKITIMKAKKAIVLSMAALAAQTAINDLKAEFGTDYIPMNDKPGTELAYTWDPTDGMLA